MATPALSRIGLDLDNTIIDYEALIREEAQALGVGSDIAGGKRAMRDALRALDDGEGYWTALQARIYGPRLPDAVPFAGALDCVRALLDAGVEVAIVSHKSRFAAAAPEGPDLRAAARAWLLERGFVGPGAISESDVWFESTRADKTARINRLRPDAFLDDLQEVFDDPGFPAGVQRWLFSPFGAQESVVDRTFASWHEVQEAVLLG